MALPHFPRVDDSMGGEGEGGFGIARAEGPGLFDHLDHLRARAASGQGRVDHQGVVGPGAVHIKGQALLQKGAKIAKAIARDGDSRRHGMTAALHQNPLLDGGAHRAAQIDARD